MNTLVLLLLSVSLYYCQAAVPLNSETKPFVMSVLGDACNSSNPAKEETISIRAVFNFGGSAFPAGPVCWKAMELALDRLRGLPDWLPDYRLQIDLLDDKCDERTAIEIVAREISETGQQTDSRKLPIFLIDDCINGAQTTIVDMIKFYNYVGFTNTLQGNEITRGRYSTTFPLTHQMQPYIAMTKFMKNMGWNKLAVFSEIHPFFNQVEGFLFNFLAESNITISWMGKVTWKSTNSVEMEENIREMKTKDPRIILSNTDSYIALSCWFHRYGMFGTSFVILANSWSKFDPDTAEIPLYVKSWCTREMVRQVAPSWIFFGYGTFAEIYGSEFPDSTGLTTTEFIAAMQQKVTNPQQSPAWGVWPWTCYSIALFAGYVVNATESVLRTRHNTTLSEWTVGSVNFEKKGNVIVRSVAEAVSSVAVNSSKGEYHFADRTTSNELGFAPILFSQMRRANGFKIINFAYYHSGMQSLFFYNGGLIWNTRLKTAPLDSAVTVTVHLQPNSTETFAVLSVLAGVAVVFVATLIICFSGHGYLPLRIRIFLEINFAEDDPVLIGNMIFLSHIFALPTTLGPNLLKHCASVTVLITTGFGVSCCGIFIKLLNGSRRLVLVRTIQRTTLFLLAIFLAIVHLALALAFIFLGGLRVEQVNLPEYTSEDLSITYYQVRSECRPTFVNKSELAVSLAMAGLHLGELLAIGFLTQQIRTKMKGPMRMQLNPVTMADLNLTTICSYCQIVVIAAGVAIACIQFKSFPFIAIDVAVTAIVFCSFDLVIIYVFKASGSIATNGVMMSMRSTNVLRTEGRTSSMVLASRNCAPSTSIY